MEILILILVLVVLFILLTWFVRIFFYLFPILIISYGIYYIFFARKERPRKEYQDPTNPRPRNDDIIDVEFTVHDEEDDKV